MNYAAIWGALATGLTALIIALATPFVTRRANKDSNAAADALSKASEAEKIGSTAIAMYDRVDKRLEKTESKLEETESRCNRCLNDLSSALEQLEAIKRRAIKRDKALDAIHQALLQIDPLLDADTDAKRMLRAAIRALSRARWDEPDDEVVLQGL